MLAHLICGGVFIVLTKYHCGRSHMVSAKTSQGTGAFGATDIPSVLILLPSPPDASHRFRVISAETDKNTPA